MSVEWRWWYWDDSVKSVVVLTSGPKPQRRPIPYGSTGVEHVWADMAKSYPNVERRGPPPTADPIWYVDHHGIWRCDPVRKPEPFREGIHALLGIAAALISVLPLVRDIDGWEKSVAFGLSFILVLLFLAYEITEGFRIRDWAYRDIGGFLIGYFVCSIVGSMLLLFSLELIMATYRNTEDILQLGRNIKLLRDVQGLSWQIISKRKGISVTYCKKLYKEAT